MRRFGEAGEALLQEEVATALLAKGLRFEELDRPKEAIAIYGEVVRRFGGGTQGLLQTYVALAKEKLAKSKR